MSSKAKSIGKSIYKKIVADAKKVIKENTVRRVWEVVNTETQEIEPMSIALNANAIGIACMKNLTSKSSDWTVIPAELEEGDELFEGQFWDYPYLEKDIWFVYIPRFSAEGIDVDNVVSACWTEEEAKKLAGDAAKDLGFRTEIRKS